MLGFRLIVVAYVFGFLALGAVALATTCAISGLFPAQKVQIDLDAESLPSSL
jgi:hypothetical protein